MARRSTIRRRNDRTRNSSTDTTTNNTRGFGRRGGRNSDDKLPVWIRLLFKFLAYGAVMLFIKYSQQNKNKGNNPKEEEEKVMPKRKKMGVRTFTAGNGVEVYVVRNFLPEDVSLRWRGIMSEEWRKQMDHPKDNNNNDNTDKEEKDKEATPSWMYATNNAGSFNHDFNRKYRSLDNIPNRNETAQEMYQSGWFSYAKWELDRSHPLVGDIEDTFVSEEVRNRVRRIINKYASKKKGEDEQLLLLEEEFSNQLADLFVTHYWTGDFLSPHNDGVAGTWAFVLSLMEGPEDGDDDNTRQWEQDFGGILRFTCPTKPGERDFSPPSPLRWCETVRPSFNTALFFRTRPRGPYHEVMPVSWRAEEEGFHRFAVTGWYMDPKDDMDEFATAERDKMRARDTAATEKDEF